ncbi:MAG: hypothetical protein Q4D38_03350 [Planctomycetia bacterium]|nr:hypothetical protein [Planctomycetia bacterium]
MKFRWLFDYTCLVFCLLSFFGSRACAQSFDDVVVTLRGSHATLEGRITMFNRNGLYLRQGDETIHVEANAVLEIQFPKSTRWQYADQCFAMGNYDEAARAYEEEFAHASEKWQKTFLGTRIMQCFVAQGNEVRAIGAFSTLTRIEPNLTDEALAPIPLAWFAQPGNLSTYNVVQRGFRNTSNPWASLVYASHLLSGAQRNEAVARLKSLLDRKDDRLTLLAQAQLWRTEITTVSLEVAQSRRETINALPPELRSGPCFVLGQIFAHLGEWDAAALEFLKAAEVHPVSEKLKEEALKRAAQALKAAGHEDESRRCSL